jgi:hypothetical protein
MKILLLLLLTSCATIQNHKENPNYFTDWHGNKFEITNEKLDFNKNDQLYMEAQDAIYNDHYDIAAEKLSIILEETNDFYIFYKLIQLEQYVGLMNQIHLQYVQEMYSLQFGEQDPDLLIKNKKIIDQNTAVLVMTVKSQLVNNQIITEQEAKKYFKIFKAMK